mmetsp:Transcript_24522/g.58175  ORF Transcript_24522/g.58175 Transcript_24522/m.58175 type:complete len:803 (-) Transcript_24522:136-2544(-)
MKRLPPLISYALLVVQLLLLLTPPLSPSQFQVVNGQEELSDQEFDPSITTGTDTNNDNDNNNGIHPDVVSTAGTLTSFVPPAAYSYRSQILYVDRDEESLVLPPYHRLSANFIRPPPTPTDLASNPPKQPIDFDDRLCEFVETPIGKQPMEYEFAPVALLVRLGGCTLQRKIDVALDMRSNHIANDTLWSIMFYNEPVSPSNTDVDDPMNSIIRPLEDELSEVLYRSSSSSSEAGSSGLFTSTTVGDVVFADGIDQFIFASLSYRTGKLIIQQMDRTSDRIFGTTSTNEEVDGSSSTGSARPELYSEGNEMWRFPVSLERGSNPYRPARDITNGNRTDDGERTVGQMMFIWFRFILFGFLACFPCIRFVRLWFGAGGRIRFRRDPETNRIVGLYLESPTDEDWLHPHGMGLHHHGRHGNDERRRSRQDRRQLLTKEQVVELLPEIEYTRPATAQYAEDEEQYNHNQQHSNIHENDNGDLEMGLDTEGAATGAAAAAAADENDAKDSTSEISIPAIMASDDVVVHVEDEDGARQHDDNNNNNDDSNTLDDVTVQLHNNNEVLDTESGGDNDHIDEAATTINHAEVHEAEENEGSGNEDDNTDEEEKIYTTTKSTTCSICIDEFEEGEPVRLLPRCGHAYHTDCILPWLTERQGHCPLCKVSVLTPSQRREHQQNHRHHHEDEHETENEEEGSDGEGEGLNRYDQFETFSGGQDRGLAVDATDHEHETENEERTDAGEGMNRYEPGGTPFVIGGGTAGSGGTPFVIGGGTAGSAAEATTDEEAANGDNSDTRNDEENQFGSQQQ